MPLDHHTKGGESLPVIVVEEAQQEGIDIGGKTDGVRTDRDGTG